MNALWLLPVLLLSATPLEELQMGEAYLQQGKPDRAVRLLDQVKDSDKLQAKERARAYQALGTAMLMQREPEKAAKALERSLELDRSVERSWLLLGMASDDGGDSKKARAVYRRGIKTLKQSWRLRHELAMALLADGDVKAGAELLQQAVKLAPNNVDVRVDHAYANSMLGRFKIARESAQQAIAIAPRNPDAYYNLGNAELGLERRKQARDAYHEAIRHDAQHIPSHYRIALLAADDKDHKTAIKHCVRILKMDPEHASARAVLGLSLFRSGRKDKAETQLEKAILALPDRHDLHAALAEIAEEKGDKKTAIKRWRAVRVLVPAKAEAIDARLKTLESGAKVP